MTRRFCDISGKEIKEGEANYGRRPLTVPVAENLSLLIITVADDGRCNVADLGKAGLVKALESAIDHLRTAPAPQADPTPSTKPTQ